MKDDAKRLAGQREEDRVYEAVSKLPGIKIWRNVYIPCGRGLTAEIDLLIISPRAVIALEVKNYGQGRVVGSQRRYEWVLDKGKGAKPRRFYSLKQSDRHLEAVSRYLGVSPRCCKGLVVFSDSTVLKKVPRTPSCTILNTRNLRGCLRRILASRKPCFSPTELRRIAQRLDAVTKASDVVKRRRHILQAREAERARKAEQERRAEQRRRRASRKRR